MTPPIVSRGFGRRRPAAPAENRLPPGQFLTTDYPVLSYGPTPHVDLSDWSFDVRGLVDNAKSWSWSEFMELPQETFTVDIHCVTKWTKLDMTWTGVSLDTFLDGIEPRSKWVSLFGVGGYTSNLPLSEVVGGRAWVVHSYDGMPLAPEHGGPARAVVPGRYFWKSPKWIRGIQFTATDEPGFWERGGYSNEGDPWREQRYAGD